MTQTERVIKHLKEYGSITPLEAIREYGITRLGARIWDLRDLGYDIETQTETSKNRFGEKTSYAKYVLKGWAKMNLYQDTDKFIVEKYGSHEEWLKKRGRGIGGSDAACFMDLNPWKTLNQLWHDKKFGSQQITNDTIEYGNTAEPCLRTLFQAKHPELDVQYVDNVTLVSKEHEFLRYSPDGLIYNKETGERGILEIKTSKIINHQSLQKWGSKGNETVPDNYYCQTLEGLIVTDFEFVIYCAELRFADGDARIIERSYRKEEALDSMNDLKQAMIEKWDRYFIGDVEPPITLSI